MERPESWILRGGGSRVSTQPNKEREGGARAERGRAAGREHAGGASYARGGATAAFGRRGPRAAGAVGYRGNAVDDDGFAGSPLEQKK